MTKTSDKYIPAFGQHWLTPLYDPLQRWIMRETRFKNRLLAQAGIQPGYRVLDLGCGTGTLTVLIKQSHPRAEVVGLDADPQVLAIAAAKAAKARVDIKWDQSMAFQLPYPDHSFDRVLSSMVMHHLNRENKQRTLREVYRVLRAGGEAHIADIGKPQNTLAYLISLVARRFERLDDNIKGLLPEMMRAAGFVQVIELAPYMTAVGTLALYQGRKPE